MRALVKDYYGQQLQGSDDLKTNACCDASPLPTWLKPLLARVHPEVNARYYGRAPAARGVSSTRPRLWLRSRLLQRRSKTTLSRRRLTPCAQRSRF